MKFTGLREVEFAALSERDDQNPEGGLSESVRRSKGVRESATKLGVKES